jgi:hypothetical protein
VQAKKYVKKPVPVIYLRNTKWNNKTLSSEPANAIINGQRLYRNRTNLPILFQDKQMILIWLQQWHLFGWGKRTR